MGLIGGIQPTPDVEYARAGGTWAGEVANSYLIEASAATFTEPSPNWSACPGAPQNTGYWTGIGGVSNSLIQNGTGQQTDANGNITKDGNLWWEVVSSGYSDGADLMTQSGSTITVPEGAAMGLETEWDLTDSTSTDWAFYFSWGGSEQ